MNSGLGGFSIGDGVALGSLALGTTIALLNERRLRREKAKATALEARDNTVEETRTHALVHAVQTKVDEVLEAYKALDMARQKHELEFARFQENASANMLSISKRQDEHGRHIENLQAQIRNVATGSGNRVIHLRQED